MIVTGAFSSPTAMLAERAGHHQLGGRPAGQRLCRRYRCCRAPRSEVCPGSRRNSRRRRRRGDHDRCGPDQQVSTRDIQGRIPSAAGGRSPESRYPEIAIVAMARRAQSPCPRSRLFDGRAQPGQRLAQVFVLDLRQCAGRWPRRPPGRGRRADGCARRAQRRLPQPQVRRPPASRRSGSPAPG